MILMLAMAATLVETCPGGPLFVFQPGSAKFTSEADRALPGYLENLNSKLWRLGWITVSPVAVDRTDKRAIILIRKRESAITKRMMELGIVRSRIRFGQIEAPWDGLGVDVYPSTLNVSRKIWSRIVTPGMAC